MAFPFYRQPDSMDCGPACLKMISAFYGRSFSLQFLREKTQIGKEGVNLLGISEAAEAVGYRTIPARVNVGQLKEEAGLPAVIHWNQNHFIVLYKIRKGVFYVADPERGLMKFPEKEFMAHWVSSQDEEGVPEGIVLLLEPTPVFYASESMEEETSQESSGHTIRKLFHYLTPHRKLVNQLIWGLLVAGLLQIALPFLTRSVVDVGVSTGNLHFVYVVLLAQLALFAGRICIEFVRSWILLHISTRINLSLLTDFLIKLTRLPASFFDSKKTGDILQRMSDHSRIESFLTGSSLNVFFSLFSLLIFSVVLAIFNSLLFIVFFISAFIYTGWILLFLKKRKELDYRRFEVAAKEQSITIQLVQGMQDIKLNGVEKQMRWGWEKLQARLFRLSVKSLKLNQWQQAGAMFINEGKNILITFLAARAVINGQMSLGEMLAVQYIIGQLNSPIEQLIGFLQSWQNAKISIERLNEVHRMDDEEPSGRSLLKELPVSFQRQLAGGKGAGSGEYITNPVSLDLPQGFRPEVLPEIPTIHFNQVSFTYPGAGNEAVLKDISLHIPKGKKVAIVGVSGSGKTTLLKLMLKFYEPQKGDIRVGGISLVNLSHKAWRSHCGVVLQDSYIFSDTIARNIAVGEDKPDKYKLEQAILIAHLQDFIQSLPLGYETQIGAEGNGLSMGQRQRILIARAVYRDPDFIFFDEATNSLDANNESIIIRNLEQFFHGRTVVVVAHRLSTVRHADVIVVLNRGVISEKGTHEELISLKGEYYALVKNQLELGD
ncbi:MAG: peptidase domain-containing ABC transporter [Chitinophagaceae bacterium]|nr:peptidase domain-containing ABC transporter [Chitinophagaceae bacterium]MBL0333882.1 peptidase domain-containing ABC transporter [Chitinophagaceae bacterium]